MNKKKKARSFSVYYDNNGINILDYLAAKIIQAKITYRDPARSGFESDTSDENLLRHAKEAYRMAQAMIEARSILLEEESNGQR